MPRFQNWEKEPWNWGGFRRLPVDFQMFAAIGVLGTTSAIVLVAALLTFSHAS
jgi:hypothetical protein